jgi:hypothetical protein
MICSATRFVAAAAERERVTLAEEQREALKNDRSHEDEQYWNAP